MLVRIKVRRFTEFTERMNQEEKDEKDERIFRFGRECTKRYMLVRIKVH